MSASHHQPTESTYPNRDRLWLAVIIVAHIILALVYWHYTPFGAPPDEGPHALYVRSLAENHHLPVFEASDRANYEAHQPPLYYALGVPFYLAGRALGMYDPGEMVRLLSMILGALSILVIYAAVRRAFPEEPNLGIGAAGFAALLPTHVMLSSSVSNDILVELVFGLAILMATQIALNGVTLRRTLVLGAILGIGLLTKTTCILLFPVALAACIIAWSRGRSSARSALGYLGIALVVGIAIGGWWLIRNRILYGDPLALTQFTQAFEHTAKPDFWLSRGLSITQYWLVVAVWTFCSFWGVFGHMKVFMPTWVYIALAAVTPAVKIGSFVRQIGLWRESRRNADVVVIYYVVCIFVVAAFIKFNISFFQAQGRYLYPALVPLSAFWALGIGKLLPARMRDWSPCLAIGIPALVQIAALATCIIPRMPYYQ